MKGNMLKYLLLFLLSLAMLSCVKQTPEDPVAEAANTILYSVTVSQSPITRVALDGDEFGAGCYVFESGDRLFVEHKDGETLKLYGVLSLVSGAGTGIGRFEGELKCLDGCELPLFGLIRHSAGTGPEIQLFHRLQHLRC